jgi:integrase
MAAILKGRPRWLSGGGVRDLVFGNGAGTFLSWSHAKARLDAKIAGAGKTLQPWSIHDLRRSCASGMQRLGTRVEVIERALNHVSGSFRGVAGIYQRDPMTADVRDALEKWAEHVLAVVEGRIVPQRSA